MNRITLLLPLFLLLLMTCSSEDLSREIIRLPDQTASGAPISPAVRVGNRLYLSGQLGFNPDTRELPADFESQAKNVMKNIEALLHQADFDFTDVVQCQVFVTDMTNYGIWNQVYAPYFKKGEYPARCVIGVNQLPAGGLVEVMMVAVKHPAP